MGLALPVLPSPGFRDSVLAGAASVGGGGTTGALVIGVASKAGGAAASGAGGGVLGGGGLNGGSAMGGGIGATALAAVTGAGKVALVALAATGAAVGGEAVVTEGYERVTTRDDSSRGIGENRGSERVGQGERRLSNGPGRRAGRRLSRRGSEPLSRKGRAAESRDHGGRRDASEGPDPPAFGGTRAKRDRGTDRSESPAQNPSNTRPEAGKGGGRPAASQHEATAELSAPKPPSVPHSRTPPEVLDAPGVEDIAPKLRDGPRAP